MVGYSDDELLTAIKELAAEYGRPPTLQEIEDETAYSRQVYYTHFGSWQAALEVAGFEPRPPQSAIPDEKLVEELQRLAEKFGRPPTIKEMNEQGEYWGSTYKNHFDSWAAAIAAAGYNPDYLSGRISDDDLLNELTHLGQQLDKRPTFREMEEQGAYDPKTYVRRFGSWNDALEAAGFEPSAKLTKDELRTDLQQLADKLNKQPTQREMNEYGERSHNTYVNAFGSWSNAIDEALHDEHT
ncbi:MULTISPECIES: homing endonuclease associated repeat-containing protein [Halobacterium]|uniref:homing endonuclease associated repeat-containing protein n=1 Tax=Halobacterium TaxID=2239 RepID=UPI000B008BF2|nr:MULTISPECIES: hypothetical protein [Halobacterium]MCG1004955.1 hypothetical protein [Halobacterium noricense]